MARPRKPAEVKKGKSESKEHLDERAEIENKLKGGTDIVYSSAPSTLDELGVKYYWFIVEQLKPVNILSNLDIPVITQTADALSQLDQLDIIIHRDGLTVLKTDKWGENIIEHPAIATKMKYFNLFKVLATQLGLSPSSRAQLAEMSMTQEENEKDPIQQMFKARQNKQS